MNPLTQLLSLYHYPLGDQARLLRSLATLALALAQTELHARCLTALKAVEAAIKLREARHVEDGERKWSPKAVELDRLIDADAAFIHSLCTTVASRPSHPQAEVARDLLSALFTPNLAAFTQLRFTEQILVDQRLVNRLQNEARSLVEAFALGDMVQELTERVSAFEQEVDFYTQGVSSAEIAAAEAVALNQTISVIHLVLSAPVDDAAKVEVRDQLARPILLANEDLNHLYAEQRRKAADAKAAELKAAELKAAELKAAEQSTAVCADATPQFAQA